MKYSKRLPVICSLAVISYLQPCLVFIKCPVCHLVYRTLHPARLDLSLKQRHRHVSFKPKLNQDFNHIIKFIVPLHLILPSPHLKNMPECSTKDFLPSFNSPCQGYTYESLLEIVSHLKTLVSFAPKVGIICGSGLGSLADSLENKTDVPYEQIPHFPSSTVQGHGGSLVFGYLSGVPVVCMKGRFHYYEGYPLWKCVMPVRVMRLLGVSHLIATNAAGGLNDNYQLGDIVLIKDHINFMGFSGNNALQGPNEDRFGPRFPAINEAYDKDLRNQAKVIAKENGLEKNLHEGVYACLGGPNYESIAELKMLKMVGVDTVGMSTVHEVITAVHCGLKVFAFSLVTNVCVMDYDDNRKPNHEEVIAAAKNREESLKMFVSKLVEYIGKRS